MFSLVSILNLYEVAIASGLTLAVRLTPMIDGYTVRVQVGRHDGPCPRFEKHFPSGTPVNDAMNHMAHYPLEFFGLGRGGLSSSTDAKAGSTNS